MSKDQFEIVPIGKLFPSPTNPRKKFDQAQLSELAESIKAHGIIQPLVVRSVGRSGPDVPASLEIVAGERRFRAAQMAKVAEVPVINRVLTDDQVIEIQVIENAQRADVHPLEESEAFGRMIQIGYDAEGIAAKIGKPRAYVLQRLSLSKLSATAREWFEEGYLLIGHALILVKFDTEEQDAILKAACYEWNATERTKIAPSISQIYHIARGKEVLLSKATWDLGDASLHPRGACTTCAFNTGYGLLGDEETEPRCLKYSCFDAKRKEHASRVIAAAQEAHPEITQVIDNQFVKWQHTFQSEPGKGYTPAIVADHLHGYNLGDVVYFKKYSNASASKAEQEKAALAAKKTVENKAILAAALEELPRIKPGSPEFRSIFARLILNTAAGFQSLTVVKKLGENQADREAAILAMEVPQLVELWVLMTMSTKCKVESWCDYSDTIRDFATTVGIDIEHVVRELDEAKPAAKPKTKKEKVAAG